MIVGAIGYDIWFTVAIGYFPQPYFYDSQDTWMDWFNTAYYAHHGGAYDDWRSIYFPLSFVILKLLTWAPCYAREPLDARVCDAFGIASIHFIFLINIPLTYLVFRKLDRSTAVWRTVAMCLGLPMTYTLERGNLLLITYTFLLLAYGPLVRSARLRWLFSGLAVNMKIYLVGTVFAQLLRHRWRWFEGALIAAVFVYIITYAVFGEGSPFQIAANLVSFGDAQASQPLDAWYPSTYRPLIMVLGLPNYPITATFGSKSVDTLTVVLPFITGFAQASILCAALAAWLRPAVVPMYRLIALSIGLALMSVESGGYTQILFLPFVFMEQWQGFGRRWALVAAYVLCIPTDVPITAVSMLMRDSFATGRVVFDDYQLTVGHFLRPGLFMSIPVALAFVTIRDVYLHARQAGWRLPPYRGLNRGATA